MKHNATALALLHKAGFALAPPGPLLTGIHATIAPEPVNLSPDHFAPKLRHLFVGKAKGGYYVTSSIYGTMRRYRCRRSEDAQVANIFGKGKTQLAAVRDFLANFTATPKRYNVHP